MKFAIVSDDEKTISRHFGQARSYLVFTSGEGIFMTRESRPKPAHEHHGHAEHNHQHSGANALHQSMADPILDCEAVITGGMGRGAYQSLQAHGIRAIITDLTFVEEAVNAYMNGTLVDHPERLH